MWFEALMGVAQIGAAVMQASEQKEARKETIRAQQQRAGIEQEQNRIAARNTLREARIRRAMIQAAAANTGSKGSGEMGAMGSIGSMAGASMGFQGMQAQASRNTSMFLNNASRAQGRAQNWQAFGQLAGQASDFYRANF